MQASSAGVTRLRSDADRLLVGDEAMVATADLLYQRMRSDDRLRHHFRFVNVATLADKLRLLLSEAFGGNTWPSVEVTEELIDRGYDQLVDAMLEALGQPLPLGCDPFETALTILTEDVHEDDRVEAFIQCVQDGAVEDVRSVSAEEGQSRSGGLEVLPELPDNNQAVPSFDDEINVQSFDELVLSAQQITAVREVLSHFVAVSKSQEVAGEAIFTAIFESAPSLQHLFTSPRAVQAMKFMDSLRSFVNCLDDPPLLKTLVETMGFRHLHLDVTISRVALFKNAILDLLMVEVSERCTVEAVSGWNALLNYIGGAIIYVKVNYGDRLTLILQSWNQANSKTDHVKKATDSNSSHDSQEHSEDKPAQEHEVQASRAPAKIPTTFPEMFRFNSAVMGFTGRTWLKEVLDCFDNIVVNVTNSARLQEECDILTLRISRLELEEGDVKFSEYKSCMLASLRSLLPKDWTTSHEVAWSWLWDNVERLLMLTMGKPAQWEPALAKLLGSLGEIQKFNVRRDIYVKFFESTPAGQDHFKQSNTYLHFIAERVLQMTLDLYRDPVKMVDDVSSLGLRHVGYGIPTELFGPFVTAVVEVIAELTQDPVQVEAFRWSLGVVSKMLVRTISEGSTIVMKAINANSGKLLQKAVACAPRGERSRWVLTIQVGTQSISPLSWSLESGNLDATYAIINDLTTIRADRDRYYYGVDELFERHPDIVMRLREQAPALMPVFFDGLIWRSRQTDGGLRRVNFYIKHLIVNPDGSFAQSCAWIAESRDPKIVCHQVIALISDMVWSNVSSYVFLLSKSWLFLTLVVFIIGQSIVGRLEDDGDMSSERFVIYVCRVFVYFCSMTQLIYVHTTKFLRSMRTGDLIQLMRGVLMPRYLTDWQEVDSLVLGLSLIAMLCIEPILLCWRYGLRNNSTFTEECPDSDPSRFSYTFFSMMATFFYFLLLSDLAVFSNRVSAYVLVCRRMLSEFSLFVLAFLATVIAFASATSALNQESDKFSSVFAGVASLYLMALGLFNASSYSDLEEEPILLSLVCCFLIATTVFLTNLLAAQLTCAYDDVMEDMVGYARLRRMEIIVEMMPKAPLRSWRGFVKSLQLDEPLEFNAGDIGLAGGIQVLERASANPTTTDTIKRFGGSSELANPWPDDADTVLDEKERFARMEKLVQRAMKRMAARSRGSKVPQGEGSGGGTVSRQSASTSSSSSGSLLGGGR